MKHRVCGERGQGPGSRSKTDTGLATEAGSASTANSARLQALEEDLLARDKAHKE